MRVTAATNGFRTLSDRVVKPITAATSAEQRETVSDNGTGPRYPHVRWAASPPSHARARVRDAEEGRMITATRYTFV